MVTSMGLACRLLAIFAAVGRMYAEETSEYESIISRFESVAFYEPFDDSEAPRWSNAAGYDGKYMIGNGSSQLQIEGEQGLILPEPAKRYGVSTLLENEFYFQNQEFVFQYEVRLHQFLQCGGAYVKLLRGGEGFSPESLTDSTPYTIMFGPDKCGNSNKHHLKNPPGIMQDRETHLYTLALRRNNTFGIFIDTKLAAKGSLLSDFEPPINPPKYINDPADTKPLDWVDEKEIPDPDAEKPKDWDETQSQMIPDPKATKPEGWVDDAALQIPDPGAVRPADWDDEEDGQFQPLIIDNPACKVGCGEWKPPQIPNPLYKGKWSAPMIPNPEYKGEWVPRQIENVGYFEEKDPYSHLPPIAGVGIEVWTMQGEIEFDNIWMGTSLDHALEFSTLSWKVKHDFETFDKNQGFYGFIFKNLIAVIGTAFIGLATIYCICCARGTQPDVDQVIAEQVIRAKREHKAKIDRLKAELRKIEEMEKKQAGADGNIEGEEDKEGKEDEDSDEIPPLS
ncbi:hypothetical protein AAMO2058_001338900 [Amorphochlora amoebiformis]